MKCGIEGGRERKRTRKRAEAIGFISNVHQTTSRTFRSQIEHPSKHTQKERERDREQTYLVRMWKRVTYAEVATFLVKQQDCEWFLCVSSLTYRIEGGNFTWIFPFDIYHRNQKCEPQLTIVKRSWSHPIHLWLNWTNLEMHKSSNKKPKKHTHIPNGKTRMECNG